MDTENNTEYIPTKDGKKRFYTDIIKGKTSEELLQILNEKDKYEEQYINEIIEELQQRTAQKSSKPENTTKKRNTWGIIGLIIAGLVFIIGLTMPKAEGLWSMLWFAGIIISIVGCFFKPRKLAVISLVTVLLIGPIVLYISAVQNIIVPTSYGESTGKQSQQSSGNIRAEIRKAK